MRRQRRIGRSTRIPQDAEPSLPPRLRTLRRRARSTASGEPGGTIRRRSRSTGSRACRCLRRCTLAPPEPVEPRAGALLTGFGLGRTRLASLERMHRGVAERHPLLVLQTGNVVVRQRVRHDALLWSRSTSGLTTRRRGRPTSSIEDANIDVRLERKLNVVFFPLRWWLPRFYGRRASAVGVSVGAENSEVSQRSRPELLKAMPTDPSSMGLFVAWASANRSAYRRCYACPSQPRHSRDQPGSADHQLDRAPSVVAATPACSRDRESQSKLQRRLPRGTGRAPPRPTHRAGPHPLSWALDLDGHEPIPQELLDLRDALVADVHDSGSTHA